MAVLLLTLSFGMVACSSSDDAVDSSTDESTEATATDGRSVSDVLEGWQSVTLISGQTILGTQGTDSDDSFLVLEDTYFVAIPQTEDGEATETAEVTDGNMLQRSGDELYKPLPRLVIPWESVMFTQPLHPDSSALATILEFEEQDASAEIPPEGALTSELKAVFTATGDTFFGFTSVEDGAVAISPAYILSLKDQETEDVGAIESLDDLSLLPASSEALGTANELVIPLDKVLYMQTLASDSPVVEALASQ